MFPFPLHIYIEISAFLTSVLLWKHLKNKTLRWFLPYLSFIVLIEFTGRFFRTILHEPNIWLYNLSIPLEYSFFTFIFWKKYRYPSFKNLAGWFLVIFPVLTFINLFFYGIFVFNGSAIVVGSFFMILFSLLFFYDLYLRTDELNLWFEPMFWISAGVLLFNAGELTYNLFSSYLITKGMDKAAGIFNNINNNLILVLYSCLIISFICLPIKEKFRKE